LSYGQHDIVVIFFTVKIGVVSAKMVKERGAWVVVGVALKK
jgi:hypothetical protein